jgi:hypothetical protein
MAKLKVLLHWWYDRADLTKPFLEMQDSFDFTVIFYKYPQQETSDLSNFPFKRIYWSQYHSPYEILSEIRPDLLLLFGFTGKYSLALLLAARVRSIPSCYLTHGIHGTMEDTLKKNLERLEGSSPIQYSDNNRYFKSARWRSVSFLAAALSLKNVSAFPIVAKYIFHSLKKGPIEIKLSKIQSPVRLPDYQIFFAPAYIKRFVERDNLDLSTVFYSGPFTMDSQFRAINNAVKEVWTGNNVLFIDQPMIMLPKAHMVDFYLRIARAFDSQGKKLIIKLHPLNYTAEWLPVDKAIDYVRNEEPIAELINKSEACLGFYSTLLLPIICKRKCILFNPGNNSIVKAWQDAGVVKVVDFYSFGTTELNLENFNVTPEAKAHFISEFIHDNSGQCATKLKTLLLDIAGKKIPASSP